MCMDCYKQALRNAKINEARWDKFKDNFIVFMVFCGVIVAIISLCDYLG